MRQKVLFSLLLVSVYFIMGVATSQNPRMQRTPMPQSSVNINDSKHILFFESFQDNKNAWVEGKYAQNEYYFDKGRYFMQNTDRNSFAQAEVSQEKYLNERDDWIVESRLYVPSENQQGTAYILFGKEGDDFHCYGFSLKGNKYELFFGSRQDGKWIGESVPVPNRYINETRPLLSIHKRSGGIDYYINKQLIARGAAPVFFGNKIGLGMGGLLRASFDELTIKQLQFAKSRTATYSTNRKDADYDLGAGEVVQMQKRGELYFMPMRVNDAVSSEFIFDQWTTDVVISEPLVKALISKGTIKQEDWIGENEYTFSDGSKAPSSLFVLHKLQVGERTIENIDAMIIKNAKAEMVIGPSVLRKLGDYSFEEDKRVLLFRE